VSAAAVLVGVRPETATTTLPLVTQLRLGVVLAERGERDEARALLETVRDVVARATGSSHSFHREAEAVLARARLG
jgi:predicted negative regulator of RcsB-dependent stress response